MNSREIAFLALCASLKNERYISEVLEEWKKECNPSLQDYYLAQQIAFGSAQMALALDYLLVQASEKGKINLKLKEKALLRTAIYQIYYLDKIPLYAIVDESMKIAKKHFHKFFANYMNAVLRKFEKLKPKLPQGTDLTSLSIRYSYPTCFVKCLMSEYGTEKAMHILEMGNKPANVMARIRGKHEIPQDWKLIIDKPIIVATFPRNVTAQVAVLTDYYIQNVTPAYLMAFLYQQRNIDPKKILDLCASPGGKSIAAHDFFPKAKLYANDVSLEKTKRIEENFAKYHISAIITCEEGQNFSSDEFFDLIILDVPCSNTGVLNKRPEARWRLDKDNDHSLESIQWALLKNAVKLLKEDGEIWYMTCSILANENETMIKKASETLGLAIKCTKKILPNEEGWDGGFASCLQKIKKF